MTNQGSSQLSALQQNNEDIVTQAPVVKPRHVRFARIVSTVLTPVSVSLPFVLLVAFYHARNQLAALIYALITLFFLSVGPLIYVVIGVRTGKLSDFDVSRRSERAGPFLFGIISTSIGLLVLSLLHGPRDLQTALILTTISAVILMVTTLWWKISIHASTMAGAATMLTVLYGLALLPLFLLLVLVSWSRVVLRRHTVAQVVAGSLLSIFLALVVLKLRGI
ncbi:MAG TPA: phosphatase PAP2 family protein [Ktedonobacteraceae bacterium]|jgi:membrane-associated phospholipid phosphatase|nr:phosphatase PAP2 family protein [Ktedonobacteraceae bacterium]